MTRHGVAHHDRVLIVVKGGACRCEDATLGPNASKDDGVCMAHGIAKVWVRVCIGGCHGDDGGVGWHVNVRRHGGLIGRYVKGPVSLGVDGVSGCGRGALTNPLCNDGRGTLTRCDAQQLRNVLLTPRRYEGVVCHDRITHDQRVRFRPVDGRGE